MKINFYRVIDAVFLLGIFVPFSFEWCAYSERGFTGEVMIYNPLFMVCVAALLLYRKNIRFVLMAHVLMLLSYLYSPAMLLRSLTFMKNDLATFVSLLQPAFLISFFFALLWGMWIIISIYTREKTYFIETKS